MTELNSDDPKVYANAYEELSYFIPRLSLTSVEQSALEILERLATGNPMGLPTRIAVAMLEPGPPSPVNWRQFERIWNQMRFDDPIPLANRLFAIAEMPKLGTLLKSRLPAIKAEEKQIRKWLAELSSDERDVSLSAFRSLRYFQPTLKVRLEEQLELGESDRFKSLWFSIFIGSDSDPYPGTHSGQNLSFDGKMLWLTNRDGSGLGMISQPLEKMSPAPWTRARLAILALERNGSEDSITVLKQLADGHPDILPTKEAKAALRKLGK